MNTTETTTTKETDHGPVSADIDFDTRLALASVGADVLLSQHGTEEAHAAVTAAVAEADRYALNALLTQRRTGRHRTAPETFRSHPALKLAGDLIRKRGWVQHQFEAEDGALCTLAAVSEASSRSGADYYDATQELIRRIGDVAVAEWNDRNDRTVDDVLRVLW